MDFSGLTYAGKMELKATLDYLVEKNAFDHQVVLKEKSYEKKFFELIEQVAQSEKAVILIDEYDKPIIDYVLQPKIAEENREVLKGFYSVIKALDEHIRFVFLTGVSKFSKVSVFSGLNNLRDITLSEEYAVLLGYTQEELEHYFADYIRLLSQKMNMKRQELLNLIKEWYNGYSWNGKDFVYNPFSVLNFFQESQFQNFWFSSGTPSFLLKLIRDKKEDIRGMEAYEADMLVFDSYEIGNMHPISLLFQSGYLTIKEIRQQYGLTSYILSYPNHEVKDAFLKYILGDFTDQAAEKAGTIQRKLVIALHENNLAEFRQSRDKGLALFEMFQIRDQHIQKNYLGLTSD